MNPTDKNRNPNLSYFFKKSISAPDHFETFSEQFLNKHTMNKKYLTTLGILLAAHPATAAILVSDNFDGLAAGTNMGASADWNAKWASASTQQGLYKADGSGAINLDTTVAEVNYHALHQTGFVVGGSGHASATISLDFNYTHDGSGNNPGGGVNKTFFGTYISDTAAWWSGSGYDLRMSYRGGAIGNNLPAAPWVENWVNDTALGVDHDGGVAGTSSTIGISWVLTDNGTTIDAAGSYTAAGNTYTISSFDTGFASGTTLYGGFTTGWNDVGGTIDNATSITNINIDNFAITAPDPIPEPTSIVLVSLASLGIFRRRR